MTLRTIADDGYFFRFNQGGVAIGIVIDFHKNSVSLVI
jgi:hypothetical protein